jgi:murein DD-endopeptidase MepM/ murein hydrolase activator NlpD
MKFNYFLKGVIIGILVAFAGIHAPSFIARAETATELQQKIDERSNVIKQLEQEIAAYSKELDKTSAQAKTLLANIKALELSQKKLTTDIELTSQKINVTNLTLEQLDTEITSKKSEIELNKKALAKTIKDIDASDSQSFIETLLTYPKLSVFWDEISTIEQFQVSVKNHMTELTDLKNKLSKDEDANTQKKNQLVSLKDQLSVQKTSIEISKSEKDKLLTETKNKESNYKQLIADKQAKKAAFEKEMRQYESQLHLLIDPKSIPTAHVGILAWPLSEHVITQYFGNTEFAQAHTALYNGSGHNGIDLKAPIGTPIMAALDGTIEGTGNTDTACPGASYGKWVLIKHNNGLSTLYAHLSVIQAAAGQSVSTGDIIGYSGITGYATGPHLHFTVYATQGVKIISRPSVACGGAVYTLPVADLRAYLDPIGYL